MGVWSGHSDRVKAETGGESRMGYKGGGGLYLTWNSRHDSKYVCIFLGKEPLDFISTYK